MSPPKDRGVCEAGERRRADRGPQHCPVTGWSRAGFQARPGLVPLGSSLRFRTPFGLRPGGRAAAESFWISVCTGPGALTLRRRLSLALHGGTKTRPRGSR